MVDEVFGPITPTWLKVGADIGLPAGRRSSVIEKTIGCPPPWQSATSLVHSPACAEGGADAVRVGGERRIERLFCAAMSPPLNEICRSRSMSQACVAPRPVDPERICRAAMGEEIEDLLVGGIGRAATSRRAAQRRPPVIVPSLSILILRLL